MLLHTIVCLSVAATYHKHGIFFGANPNTLIMVSPVFSWFEYLYHNFKSEKMKKVLLACIALWQINSTSKAQATTDTVSLGTGYTNQLWYSLPNNEQGTAPKNNWDLMFDVSGFGSSIHINSITGTQLWRYTAADTSGWPTLDTAGIDGWTPLYNSDTSWIFGAFDKGMVFSNPNDLGWGVYNSITHIVTGDSLYVIKLASGAYKKLWIQSLASGNYNFKYANIDGSSQQSGTIVKSAYSGKNFAYFSLQSNMALDREPASANWDLLFTQYTAFIPSPYTVAGVLLNVGVTAAQANGIPNSCSSGSPPFSPRQICPEGQHPEPPPAGRRAPRAGACAAP